jgi:hypothetical protein
MNYLKDDWLVNLPIYDGLSYVYDETAKTFEIKYISSGTYTKEIDLNLGAEAESLGLALTGEGNLALNLTNNVNLGVIFDWSSAPSADFYIKDMGFNASLNANDVVLGATVGPIEASIGSFDTDKETATANISFGAAYSYKTPQRQKLVGGNPIPDAGTVGGFELENIPGAPNKYKFEITNPGEFEVYLPIYASVGGVDIDYGDADNNGKVDAPFLRMEGSLFRNALLDVDKDGINGEIGVLIDGKYVDERVLTSGNIAVTSGNFDKLMNFRNFSIVDIILMFKGVVQWAEQYRDLDFMEKSLPLIDLSLGDALDFASGVSEVLDRVDFYRPIETLFSGANATLGAPVNQIRTLSGLNLTALPGKTLDESYKGKFVTLDGIGIFEITAVGVGGTNLSLRQVDDQQVLTFKYATDPSLNNLNFVIHEKRQLLRSLDEFIVAVNESDILPLQVPLVYDPVANTFTIPVGFDYQVPVINDVNIDFGIEAGPIELYSNATIDLSAKVSGRIDLIIDFEGRTLTNEDGSIIYDPLLKDENGNALPMKGVGLYLDNVNLRGEVNFDITDLEVGAKLGILGLTAGGPGTGSQVHLGAFIETGLSGKQDFGDLLDGGLLDAFYFEINGDAYARLRGLEVDAGFGGFTISPDVELGVYVPNLKSLFVDDFQTQTYVQPLGSPFNLQQKITDGTLENKGVIFVLPDVNQLLSLKNLSFEDIIRGVRFGIQFLDNTLKEVPFYSQNIPVIDISLKDTFNFLDDLAAKMEEVAKNPAGFLQEIEGLIESVLFEPFGIYDNNSLDPWNQLFSIYLENNTLNIHLGWEALYSNEFGFDLDLNSLKGIVSDPSVIDDIRSLVDVNAKAKLLLEAIAKVNLDIGMSLDSLKAGSPEIFLYDYNPTTQRGTHATLGVRLEGQEVDLGFNIGPMRAGVKQGNAVIDGDGNINTKGDYAGLLLSLQQTGGIRPNDGKFYFDENFSDNFKFDVAGAFNVDMPLFIDFGGKKS